MPEFKIRMPDGQIRTVSGPTREGAMSFAKANYNPARVTPNATPGPNHSGTSISRALKRGALETYSAIPIGLAMSDMTSINDAKKRQSPGGNSTLAYEELMRTRVPKEAMASRGLNLNPDTLEGRKSIDALQMNYGLTGAERVDYLTTLEKRIENAKAVTQNRDAIDETFDRVKTNAQYAGEIQNKANAIPRGNMGGVYGQELAEAPDTFKGWLKTITNNPLGFMEFIGETVAESGPQIAAGMATSILTRSPKSGALVMGSGGFAREYGNEVANFLKEHDIDLADPKSFNKMFRNPELMKEAQSRGVTRGIVIAAADFAGQGLVMRDIIKKSLVRQTAVQATTEGAGEAGAQFAVGDDLSVKEIATETVAGGAAAGPQAVVAGNKLWQQRYKDGDIEYNGAAADLARTLREISQQEGLNLNDVKTQGGAKQTLEAAHELISEQIKTIIKADGVRQRLSPKNAETLNELMTNYSKALAAIRQGKNKVKSKVTKENEAAMKRLLGSDSVEAQQLSNLFAQGNVLTDLFADGTKGGVSQFTDYLNPLQNDGNSGLNIHRGLNVLGAGVGATQFGIPVTAGIVVGGRVVDSVTGRRSKINRFVKKMEKREGMPIPEGQSLIENAANEKRAAVIKTITDAEAARAQEEADARRVTLVSNETNNATNDASPLGSVLLGTGIDAKDINVVVSELRETYDPNSLAEVDVAVNEVLDNVERSAQGEQISIPALTAMVGLINGHLNTTSDVQRIALPDGKLASQAATRANKGPQPNALQQPVVPGSPEIDTQSAPTPTQGGNVATTPENYEAGKQANIAFAADLQSQVVADTSLSEENASALNAVLEIVRTESTPFADQQEMQQELLGHFQVPQEAVDKYFTPYLARSERQDRRRTVLQKAQDTQTQAEPFLLDQAMPRQNPIENRAEDIPTPPQMRPAPRQFGQTTDVSLDTGLSNAFQDAQAKTYAKGRDFKLDLQAKSLAAQEREGIDLNTLDDANIDRLADFVVEDGLEALKDNSNAIGWYDRTVTRALETVSELHPEIATDPKAKLQFVWAVAVTSNGLKVDKNFELALDVYETLKKTGRFPTDAGIGQAAAAINSGLAQYHTMLEKFQRKSNSDEGAHELLTEFMNSKVPVKQLESEYGVKISGEGKNTLVRGASILGPKIGNGFYSNLYGNFDELTMDRWLMRSVGRWRGGLVKINKPMISQKTKEIQAMLPSLEMKSLKPLFEGSGVKLNKRMSKKNVESFSNAIAKASMDPAWRSAINAIPGGQELRKAGNALAKYLDGQVEAPAGANERAFIRKVFQNALQRLQDAPEVRQQSNAPLTMSDLQALLWYPEKRLYDTAKQQDGESRGYEDNEAPDYANAARKSVQNRLEQRDRLGSPGRDGSGGRGPSVPNARPILEQNPAPILNASFDDGSSRSSSGGTTARPTFSNRVAIPEIKQAATLAKTAMIGKTGSPEQDGIQSVEQAIAFANGLGMTVRLFNTQKELVDQYKSFNPNVTPPGSTRAFLARTGKKGAEGSVFGLAPGAIQESGSSVTSLDALVSVIHEVSHGITLGPMDGVSAQNTDATFTNPITGEPDVAPPGSFVYSALRPLLEGKGDPDIMAEIDNIQQNVEVFTTKDPRQRVALRTLKDALDKQRQWQFVLSNEQRLGIMTAEQAKSDMDSVNAKVAKYTNYVQQAREIAVDPMIIYILNPALAKKIMPKTAALISSEFKKARNPSIQFFNHPLAMVVATVMAMLAKGLGEDEEKKKQMQMAMSGALSSQPPPPGILSAA